MKNFTLTFFLFFIGLTLTAATFRSKNSGVWENKNNWTPSNRYPGPGDVAIIEDGDDMTVSSAITVSRLVIDDAGSNYTELIINSTGALTVTGNVEMICDNPTTQIIPDYNNAVQSQLLIHGTLNVGGNLIMRNESYTTLGILGGLVETIASNQLIIGSPSSAGTLNITGNVSLQIENSIAQLPQNYFVIANGNVTFGGTINMLSENTTGGLTDNYLFIYDQDAYAGLSKNVYFTKSGNPFNIQQGVLTTSSSGDYSSTTWHLQGTSNELVINDMFNFGNLVIESPLVTVGSSITDANVLGKIIVKGGSTLQVNSASANLSGLTGANKVELEAGATFSLKDAGIANGLPADGVLNAHPSSYVDFNVSQNNNYNVLTTDGVYPLVTLSGKGTKTFKATNAIDDTNFKVGGIEVTQGTFALENGVSIHLNDVYGNNTLAVAANATLKLEGTANIDAFADLDRESITNFASTSAQNLVVLNNASGQTEPFGILKLTSGSGSAVARNVAALDVLVENKLELGNNVSLNLNNNGYIHLLSDASYTAYLDEVPSSASINYSGTGNFIVDKYFTFPGYSAPDLTSPIVGATLNSYKKNGIEMRGFPGSDKPGNRFASVSTYTEAELGAVNKGFNKPSTISDALIVKDGSNQITRSTYRVNVNPGTINLSDTGNVHTGNQTFKITFNFSDTGENSREENDGYNLLGNPFPANLDWNKVVNDPANKALFDNGYILPHVYVYKYFDRVEAEPTGNSGYGYYNPVTNFQYAQDSIIPSHQGFWVKAFHPTSASETYTLTIRESHKVDFSETRNYKAKARVNAKDIAAKIVLESNGRTDEIFFHIWPKATTYADKSFDVESYGTKSTSNPSLDFVDLANKPMQLYVNAIEQDLRNKRLPIFTNITTDGTHTLKLSNLQPILNKYACTYLLDKVTNEKIALENNINYTFTSEPFTGVRFEFVFGKRLSDDIETEALSCHDANNGILKMDLSPVSSYSFTLFKDGVKIKSYVGFYDKIDEKNLAAGNYKMVNNIGLMTCESNEFNFVIENPAPLNVSITQDVEEVYVNDRVTFNAVGNADIYAWDLNGMVYPGATFANTFVTPGTYEVTLTYSDSKYACMDELVQEVFVQDLGTGIDSNNLPENVSIENGSIIWTNDADFVKAYVYGLNGQLLEEYDLSNKNRTSLEIREGSTIIQLINALNEATILKVNR